MLDIKSASDPMVIREGGISLEQKVFQLAYRGALGENTRASGIFDHRATIANRSDTLMNVVSIVQPPEMIWEPIRARADPLGEAIRNPFAQKINPARVAHANVGAQIQKLM